MNIFPHTFTLANRRAARIPSKIHAEIQSSSNTAQNGKVTANKPFTQTRVGRRIHTPAWFVQLVCAPGSHGRKRIGTRLYKLREFDHCRAHRRPLTPHTVLSLGQSDYACYIVIISI